MLDGLGMGLGFTVALLIVGSIREIFGSGSWFGMKLPIEQINIEPMVLFILPAGGFFTLGIIIAVVNRLANRPVREIGCSGCPSRDICKGGANEEREADK
jgi:electron transport complex protein RnfE